MVRGVCFGPGVWDLPVPELGIVGAVTAVGGGSVGDNKGDGVVRDQTGDGLRITESGSSVSGLNGVGSRANGPSSSGVLR